jgi:hypothetical protein
MDEIYLSVQLNRDSVLCVAPLTERRLALSGQDMEDPSGYFLFEKRGQDCVGEVEIIARIVSEDAARRVGHLFNMT